LICNKWVILVFVWMKSCFYRSPKLAPQRRSQRLMGGQMQQNNAAAATALYDGALPTNDAGDAVMARWLQSAGLQHLASPVASTGNDQRHLPNLLMQVIAFPDSLFLYSSNILHAL